MPFNLLKCVRGNDNKISNDPNNPRTPPNLLGIDRRIAYAKRKYHSGTICGGVIIGLAGIKLSGSPRALGNISTTVNKQNPIITNPTMSLIL